MLCCSSPTGPAFEGAQITHGQRAALGAIERVRIDPDTLEPRWKGDRPPRLDRPWRGRRPGHGICGSGIIEAVSELYLAGAITADGLFSEAAAPAHHAFSMPAAQGPTC